METRQIDGEHFPKRNISIKIEYPFQVGLTLTRIFRQEAINYVVRREFSSSMEPNAPFKLSLEHSTQRAVEFIVE